MWVLKEDITAERHHDTMIYHPNLLKENLSLLFVTSTTQITKGTEKSK